MAYLLALASALAYGAADFVGGLASRRADTYVVVLVSQFAGLVLIGATLLFMPAAAADGGDILWGGIAGLAGGTGVALLYRALAIGTMGIVAPITAVCAVIIPVGVDVAGGAQLGLSVIAGIILALAAIVLVSRSTQEIGSSRRGVGLAFLAGVAIGIFFLALANTAAAAGLWPLVSARVASVALFGVLTLGRGTSLRMAPGVAGMTMLGGVLDMGANALYLLATRYGELSAVVTLASLYPASTVALAGVLLHERLSKTQYVGIVLALAAVVLIVSGGE